MNTLSERLQEAFRRKPKLTQSGLAQACGIKAPSISDWLSGRTKKMEGANLLMAAVYLEVNPWWLATGKGQIERDANNSEALTSDNASLDWPFTISLQEISQMPPEEITPIDRFISYTVMDWKLRQSEGKTKKESAIDKHTDGFLRVERNKNVG